MRWNDGLMGDSSPPLSSEAAPQAGGGRRDGPGLGRDTTPACCFQLKEDRNGVGSELPKVTATEGASETRGGAWKGSRKAPSASIKGSVLPLHNRMGSFCFYFRFRSCDVM